MEWVNYSEEVICASRKAKEDNDCTVITWSHTFDCEYDRARKYLAQFGRRPRQGMKLYDIKRALAACKKSKVVLGPYDRNNKISLSKFCKLHNKGRYYICVRGHALCVKDGVVYDYKDGGRRQVTFACRVYLEGEI